MINNKFFQKISVVIPTLNRPKTLETTLESFFSSDFAPDQIIIVDQSDKDEFKRDNKAIVDRFSKKCEFVYIYQQKPSLTSARNASLRFIKNEIVVFSDDDIEVYRDTFLNISNVFLDNSISMIAAVDDLSSNKKESSLGYFFGYKNYKKRSIGHVTNSVLGRFPKCVSEKLVYTEWAMGFFFIVRNSLLRKWGLKWDENLTSYAYAEDLDFSFSYYKLSKKNGMSCYISNDIHVKHLVSKEYRIPSKKSTYMYVINRRYLSYKHNMGIKSLFSQAIVNYSMLIYRIIKRQKPLDLWKAIIVSRFKRKKIKKGELSDFY